MLRLTVDAATLDKLRGLGEALELCDEDGHTLGFFTPILRLPARTKPEPTEPDDADDASPVVKAPDPKSLHQLVTDLFRQAR